MGLFSGIKSMFGVKKVASPYQNETSNLMNILQKQASGQGPSVSGEQAKNAMGTNVANTMGTIKASGGINNALKAKMLSRAGERKGTDIARASAVGRAQEQVGAQSNLASFLSGTRSQEMQKESARQAQKGKLFGDLIGGASSAMAMGAK